MPRTKYLIINSRTMKQNCPRLSRHFLPVTLETPLPNFSWRLLCAYWTSTVDWLKTASSNNCCKSPSPSQTSCIFPTLEPYQSTLSASWPNLCLYTRGTFCTPKTQNIWLFHQLISHLSTLPIRFDLSSSMLYFHSKPACAFGDYLQATTEIHTSSSFSYCLSIDKPQQSIVCAIHKHEWVLHYHSDRKALRITWSFVGWG